MTWVLLSGGPADGHMIEVPSAKVTGSLMWPTEPGVNTLYVHHRIDPSTGLVVYVPEDEALRPPRPANFDGYHFCVRCDVRWTGGTVCWCCSRDVKDQAPPRRQGLV